MSAEVRPGYKFTEVGIIPVDWDISSLKEACNKITDGTHDTPKPTKAGIPFLTAIHVKDNKIHYEDCLYITEKEHEIIYKRCNPALNDVLMVNIGAGVATTALVEVSYEFSLKNVALLKPEARRLIGAYLNYSLAFRKSKITQALLSGGAQPFLSLSQICEIKIPIPTKEEQHAISVALSDIDALISGLDQLIAKKRDIQQAAMQQLLTGQRRLPGFSGEWTVMQLGDLADPKKPWSFTGGPFGSNLQSADYTTDGVRIIQLQNIGISTFHDSYAIFTSMGKADELISCNVYPGDLILSKMGDPVARACIVPTSAERFLMCSDGIRIAIDKSRFNSLFILHSINTNAFLERADAASTGSTRKRIGLTQLRRLPICCPSLKEQTAIAAILSDMDTELAALKARRNKARQLKQGMMQELLTGRIRLA